MKSQVLLTVWCHISCEAAGEFWHWSLSGVKGLRQCHYENIDVPNFQWWCDAGCGVPYISQLLETQRKGMLVIYSSLPSCDTVVKKLFFDRFHMGRTSIVFKSRQLYGVWALLGLVFLTLSLLRVINVKIPLQPHKKYDMTQYGELDFS